MKIRVFRCVLVLFLLNFALAACSVKPATVRTRPHTKYVLYIGLNDGDTGEQRLSGEQAKRIMQEIGGKYADGFTLLAAEGFWRETPGAEMQREQTLVCVFIDLSWQSVRNIMDEVLKAFNQHSILLEVSETQSLFYKGQGLP